MSENLDALLLHLGQVAPTLTPIPPVNGRFIHPGQIARAINRYYNQDWYYCGPLYVGEHGDVQMLERDDETWPLNRGADGTWSIALKDRQHYGEPDAAFTAELLKCAQENGL